MSRLRNTASVLGIGLFTFFGGSLYSGNERFYRDVVMPTYHFLFPDAEKAHTVAVMLARSAILPRKSNADFPSLQRTVFGLPFKHPVGLAAGFDKNGVAPTNLLKAGFSFVEVGTVTPRPQAGNPKPRVFRWTDRMGVINRCGFNNDGYEKVYDRLKDRHWEGIGVVGVNLGCNKNSKDPVEDYVLGVELFSKVADYLVINVSSPNTPGLRSLQQKEKLKELLTRVLCTRDRQPRRVPLLLKISPDETDQALKDIVDVAVSGESHVDGLIVSNTSLASDEDAAACGALAPLPDSRITCWGGVSGQPLRDKSTACLARVAQLTAGHSVPLIGVGGVSEPEDAQAKLEAGAQLVQLYTSAVYQGTPVAYRLARGLAETHTRGTHSPTGVAPL